MISDTISVILRIIFCAVVFLYFIFAPLKSRLRYDRVKTIMLLSSLMIVSAVITILFLTEGAVYIKYAAPAIIFWIAYAVFIFYATVKCRFLELLFIVLVVLNFYANIMTIAKLIVSLAHWELPFPMAHTITSVCILIAYVPLLWVLMFKLYKKVIEFMTEFTAWKYIWLIPALTYLIFYIKFTDDYWANPVQATFRDLVFCILWSLSSYIFFCIALLLLIETHQKTTAVEHARLISSQLKMQEEQYQQLLDNLAETARIRHDWHHHLLTISGLAKQQKLNELNQYIDRLMPVYINEEAYPVCQNHVINIILQHYRAIAKAEGITITTKAELPPSISIPDIDLCIVFGNLVENAIDACMSKKGPDKFISINTVMKHDMLVIMIKNTYGNQIVVKDGVYFSTKRSGSGMGLLSVKHVVEKNKGHMQIQHDKDYFCVKIILHSV